MARLVYSQIASLDGYVEDAKGRFDWAEPDEQVFRFITDLERPVGTYLYGRRMYETMVYWETVPLDKGVPAFIREWAETWRAAEKVVYSRTLHVASSARTSVNPNFRPEAIRRLKATSRQDISIGGADLAGQAVRAGIVDEIQLFVVPAVVGSGKPWLAKNLRLDLELLESRRFKSGFVFLRYRPRHPKAGSPPASSRRKRSPRPRGKSTAK